MTSTNPSRVPIWIYLGLGFAVALLLTQWMPPAEATTRFRLLVIATGVLVPTLLYFVDRGTRQRVDGLPLALLIGAHAIRLPVGMAFVLLGRAGQLPPEFASHAGFGDMTAGALAIVLVLVWRSRPPKGLALLWNLLGLVDFLNVQRVVATLVSQDRAREMVAVNHLPLSMVPYFALPLLFATHLILFNRLGAAREIESGGPSAQRRSFTSTW